MLYSEQAGLEVTLQDKNLILSPDTVLQTNIVLCVAPIWVDDGSNIPPADEGISPSYEPITIRKGSDFVVSGLGQYTTRNPLARLWKQATDAGASTVKVVRLHGKTLEERYIGLHNIFSILADYDGYDILVIGGVFADDQCFSTISDADDKLVAQRQALLTAYDADSFVSYAGKTEMVDKTKVGLDVPGTIEITLNENFVGTDTIAVAGETVTFYVDDAALAGAANDHGISLESDTTAADQAAAIATMTFTGFVVTAEGATVLFTEEVAGVSTIEVAVVTGTGALAENIVTEADMADSIYILSDAFVDLDSIVATSIGFVPEDFSYHAGDETTGFYPYVALDTGGDPYPAQISVTYDSIEDPTTIDTIDGASKLLRSVTTIIASSDVGVDALAVPTVIDETTVWVVDLESVDGFGSWSSEDVVVYDSNGELALQGVSWTFTNTEATKEITFYKIPTGWSFVFTINSYFDFAAAASIYLNEINQKGIQVVGVMAINPAADNALRTIKEYVAAAPFMQYSRYLQIIGGAEQIFQLNTTIYKDLWHGAYAGMLAALPSYESPLNKPIPGVIRQDYQLSAMQSLAMTNKHIIVSRKRNNYIVCSDAITTAEDNSDFVLVTTIRIVNDAVNLVRSIADPFVGKPNTIQMRAGLETSIKTGLEGMVSAGAITDYRFVIVSTEAEQLEGIMRIILELVPVFTVRKIRLSVAVRPSL